MNSKITIYILSFFLLFSYIDTYAQEKKEGWGYTNEKNKKGFFSKLFNKKEPEFGEPPKKKLFGFLRKKKNYQIETRNQIHVLEIIAETGAVKTYYFDGKVLSELEVAKITKQIKKYEKQKPNKWEKNYLEMRNRGYPVHPDTVRKYKGLAQRVERQRIKRTRKMNKIYQKQLYRKQGNRANGENVGDILKQQRKENIKKQKKRMRRLKRKQRTGHYLPFYIRWIKKLNKKKK